LQVSLPLTHVDGSTAQAIRTLFQHFFDFGQVGNRERAKLLVDLLDFLVLEKLCLVAVFIKLAVLCTVLNSVANFF